MDTIPFSFNYLFRGRVIDTNMTNWYAGHIRNHIVCYMISTSNQPIPGLCLIHYFFKDDLILFFMNFRVIFLHNWSCQATC